MNESSIERLSLFDVQKIQTAMTKYLCGIPQSSFQDCFKYLQECWKWCIDAGGSYFGEDP